VSTNEGFFAIDRRAWARVCALGFNTAVAYLVIACGTGGDNRTTKWSDQAIRKYAGLSRGRTDKAMAELKASGLVREDQGGARPRYYLMPAHEVPGCEDHVPALSEAEQRALAELKPGYSTLFSTKASGDWGGSSPYSAALELASKSLARELKGCRFEPIAYDAEKAAEPDWIWLPNTIVTGAAGETAPVQLLRQAQNPSALRLFVDLYHSHGLAEDGGVHWRRIRQNYTRHKVGERGPLVVWGFQSGNSETWLNAPFVIPHLTGQTEEIEEADGLKRRRDAGVKAFWDAWNIVVGLGLVEVVGHIIEADNDNAEIVHPYAIGNGEADERAITTSAQTAAETLLTPGQIEWAQARGLHLLPAPAHQLPNVQLVGIARLRYRPHTKATAAWFAKKQEWGEWGERYRELAQSNVSDPDIQHQGTIKVASRWNQRLIKEGTHTRDGLSFGETRPRQGRDTRERTWNPRYRAWTATSLAR
jgi:hypothetical protein